MQKKPRCCARIILGEALAKGWQHTCKKRLNGLCCKDCKRLPECQYPCSILFPYYKWNEDEYELKRFSCPYYCTREEAVFKKITKPLITKEE